MTKLWDLSFVKDGIAEIHHTGIAHWLFARQEDAQEFASRYPYKQAVISNRVWSAENIARPCIYDMRIK